MGFNFWRCKRGFELECVGVVVKGFEIISNSANKIFTEMIQNIFFFGITEPKTVKDLYRIFHLFPFAI